MSWRVALALFVLGVATRLPLATTNLYASDSVLYLRGMERFDPLDQRPQPPGYLYYVLLLRGVDLFTHDPNRAMTLVSAFAGAAAIALLYLLTARLHDERTARVSALFLFTAVTFWGYGGVAYPYTLLAALSIACALLFWRALAADASPTQRGRRLVLASAAWGIAVGFRSDLAIFLAPLWLVAAFRATVATVALAAALVAALVAGWYGASALADGGVARFTEALRVQTKFVDDRYSVFGNGPIAIFRNGYELARFLGRALYFLTPLAVIPVLSGEARRVELRDPWRTAFLALWTLAPLPFYLLIHVGEYGYVFSMLPGLCIVAARGAIALAKGIRRPRTFRWIVAAVALANAAIFLVSDTPLSTRDIARHDRGIDEKIAYLARFRPEMTQVVSAYDVVLVEHYSERVSGGLPTLGYDPAIGTLTFALSCEKAPEHKPCSGDTVDVVLWDDILRAEGPDWLEVRMPHGARLRIARVARASSLRVSEGLGVAIVR